MVPLLLFVVTSNDFDTYKRTVTCNYNGTVTVPDRRRRILPEVVLVRRWVVGVLGIWKGEGLGEGLGQGRSVYKQPETEVDGSCHS
jgi:hypothetical protein